jgi:hypothetical protein
MQYDFGIHAGLTVATTLVGRERHPVVVIDDVFRDPGSVVSFAATLGRFRPPRPALGDQVGSQGGNFYPGVRAPVPQPYLASLYGAIAPLMRETFGLPLGGPLKADCSFSITTIPPEELNVMQRLAHFDTVDSRQLAVLHYLCDPSHGGTAFYRQRGTGFEAITPERLTPYLQQVEQDLATYGPPPAQYLRDSDERFEQIASFEARFNRVLIYRSQMLHSGSVDAACGFRDDPRTGRLTANAFFYVPTQEQQSA